MKSFAQEKSITISGKLVSFKNMVGDVHVINLTNKQGTISNDNGEFEINVSLNDSLLISSIAYKRLKIRITESHISNRKIEIALISSVTILDEVYLHGLTGNLNFDITNKPKDSIPKHNFALKKYDIDKISIKGIHIPEYEKQPNATKFTDPNYIEGMGFSTGPDKRLEAKRKLKRELAKKKQFPIKIKNELGLDFFTNQLHIPEEKIDHFLAYCEYKNIIEAYNENNLLEVIKILQDESKTYYEIEN